MGLLLLDPRGGQAPPESQGSSLKACASETYFCRTTDTEPQQPDLSRAETSRQGQHGEPGCGSLFLEECV